jgi:hypothetical protein
MILIWNDFDLAPLFEDFDQKIISLKAVKNNDQNLLESKQ